MMAPGEEWGVAAHVNYSSPLSGLSFGFIFPDTENKVNHDVLWVFHFTEADTRSRVVKKLTRGHTAGPFSH